jgi:nitrate reductase assembly molybdenum cofactor insertion protein NarJ
MIRLALIPDNEPSIEEVQTIRKILELPPERLAKIRSAMERIEKMSPEERKDFAATLAKLETASPEERKKAFKDMRDKARLQAVSVLKSLSII